MERRLAAILAADVIGYSRLINASPTFGIAPMSHDRMGLVAHTQKREKPRSEERGSVFMNRRTKLIPVRLATSSGSRVDRRPNRVPIDILRRHRAG